VYSYSGQLQLSGLHATWLLPRVLRGHEVSARAPVQGKTAVVEDCLVVMHRCPVCCRASSTVCAEATGVRAGSHCC